MKEEKTSINVIMTKPKGRNLMFRPCPCMEASIYTVSESLSPPALLFAPPVKNTLNHTYTHNSLFTIKSVILRFEFFNIVFHIPFIFLLMYCFLKDSKYVPT